MPNNQIIPVESLDSTQRQLVDNYIKRSSINGALVGAVVGHSTWNIKPLILSQGTLSVLRFSDPFLAGQEDLFKALVQHRAKRQSSNFLQKVLGSGVSGNQVWCLRNFFQTTLGDLIIKNQLIPEKQLGIAADLIELVVSLEREGVVHGHLSFSNITVEDDQALIFDHAFAAFSKDLQREVEDLAPELRKGAKLETVADIFGLGLILRKLLVGKTSAEDQQLIEKMLSSNPFERPSPIKVQEHFSRSIKEKLNDQDFEQAFKPSEIRMGRIIDQQEIEKENNYQSQADLENKEVVELHLIPRKRKTTQIAMQSEQSIDEKIQWLEGTVSLNSELIEKIKAEIIGESDQTVVPESDQSQIKPEPDLLTEFKPAEIEPPVKSSNDLTNVRARKVNLSGAVKKASIVFFTLLFIVLLGLAAKKFFKNTNGKDLPTVSSKLARVKIQYPKIPLNVFWNSKLPSKMKEVVLRAYNGNSEAELLIVNDILAGSNPPQVDYELIRFVYNPKWEGELARRDRDLVLRLALSNLAIDKKYQSPTLNQVHPAVLLALAGRFNEKDISEFGVDKISLNNVVNLAAPYGVVFKKLVLSGVDNFGNERARALANLVVGKVTAKNIEKYLKGLSADSEILEAISLLNPILNKDANKIIFMNALDAAISDGKVQFNWFTANPVVNWEVIDTNSKAKIILENKLPDNLSWEYYADLIYYPSTSVSTQAIEKLGSTAFIQKREKQIQILASSRKYLSRVRLVSLLTAFKLSGEKQYSLIKRWFEFEPPVELVLNLLLAGNTHEKVDAFTVEAARYLKDKKLILDNDTLKKLLNNRAAFVRALAYSRLDAADLAQKKILKEQLAKEEDPHLRAEIEWKLSTSQ